jgi:hypothetical protein
MLRGTKRKKKWTDLDLIEEISESIEASEKLARRTYLVADLLLFISLLGSIAATLFIGNEWVSKDAAAVIAAIPALAIGLERSFKWSARSNWHFRYFLRLLAIWRKMRDEGMNQVDASGKLTELDLEMDQGFPARDFGAAEEYGPKNGQSHA